MHVAVYDWDRFSKNDLLGTGVTSASGLIQGVPQTVNVPLTPCGNVVLRMTAFNFGNQEQGRPRAGTYPPYSYPAPPMPYYAPVVMPYPPQMSGYPPQPGYNYPPQMGGYPQPGYPPSTYPPTNGYPPTM
eukprot:TRINITY_DN7250_c0_g1_i1.p1 TRINITY_DN7250_c0_g1~~TRINITY_DN7250_c0_g1_i1.p1  ORF type:complete len:130 (-),score=7.93 TRINITY_DN7250_c0_g1_i1:365-754(-)